MYVHETKRSNITTRQFKQGNRKQQGSNNSNTMMVAQ